MKQILCALVATLAFGGIISAQIPQPRLFEEFTDVPCEDVQLRIDLLLSEVANELGSIGAVVFYEGKYKRTEWHRNGKTRESWVLPTFAEAYHRIRWIEIYLNFRGFPKDRIRFVSGGYRDKFTIELWVVPRGARLPTAKPELENVKYRKGKPTEFHCV